MKTSLPLRLLLATCAVLLCGLSALAATSLEAVNDGGGAGWNRGPFPPAIEQLFCALAADRFAPQFLYALGKDGTVHTVSVQGGEWVQSPLPGVSSDYVALAANPHAPNFTYAAAAGGGIDAIHAAAPGDWTTETLVAEGRYIALAADEAKAYCLYAAKESGGVDVIQRKSGTWKVSELNGLEKVRFAALAFDRVLSNTLYALGKDGVLYELSESAGRWTCAAVPSVPEGRRYTALACSSQKEQFLFAARADGGVDAIHVWQDGNWKTDPLVPSGHFVALAADKSLPNYVYAALASDEP